MNASGVKREAAVVTLSPEAAHQFIGSDGKEVEQLAKETKSTIRVQASDSIHPERFSVICGDKSLVGDRPLLAVGQQARVTLIENNAQEDGSALAIINGNLVEVAMGAERAGKEVAVRVTSVSPYVSTAEITH